MDDSQKLKKLNRKLERTLKKYDTEINDLQRQIRETRKNILESAQFGLIKDLFEGNYIIQKSSGIRYAKVSKITVDESSKDVFLELTGVLEVYSKSVADSYMVYSAKTTGVVTPDNVNQYTILTEPKTYDEIIEAYNSIIDREV